MNSKKFVLAMVSKVTIVLLEIGFFAIVLFQYYGPTIFSNMESVGFTVTLLLYIIVYIALGNLFRAFKIADYSIAETIFSQLLAFGIAKLKYILWVEKVIPYDALGLEWKKQLDPYEAVIFYEVEGSTRRAEILWYCMQGRKSLYVTPRLEEIEMQGFGARHLIDTP